jgi:hypothetical protein
MFPSVILSFNLAPGFSLGQGMDAVATAEREIGLPDRPRSTWRHRHRSIASAASSPPPFCDPPGDAGMREYSPKGARLQAMVANGRKPTMS